MNENLQIKLVEKLVKQKFEYWKEEFVKSILEKVNELRFKMDINVGEELYLYIKQKGDLE